MASDQDIRDVYTELGKHWDGFDILVHSVGFAPREQLDGDYIDAVTRDHPYGELVTLADTDDEVLRSIQSYDPSRWRA